jgi:tRNA uridine 5-carbamoylmethylation protein Kti12
MMQYIFILCAPPGAGKTTFSHRLVEQYNAVKYSFDEMKCFKHSDLIEPIIESINKGESVVVDALYSKVRFREELLQSISNTDCKKICVCFRTSLEECINRNAKRSGRERLPCFVVEDIYNRFEPPTLDEGWDEILYY